MLIYKNWSPAGSFEEIMFFSLKPMSRGWENRLNMKWKQTFSRCGRCSFQFSLETEAILEHHSLFMAFIIYCLDLACVGQAKNLLQMHLTPVSSGWQQHTAQKHWPQCCRCKFGTGTPACAQPKEMAVPCLCNSWWGWHLLNNLSSIMRNAIGRGNGAPVSPLL